MLGWMMLFTTMSLWGAVAATDGGTLHATGLSASLVFGLLLAASVLAFTFRRHA